MSELDAIESWAGHLLSTLEAPARRAVLRDIARELRRSQQARIARQTNPDGTPYKARKPRAKKQLRDKAGRIRRNAMFAKLRQARYLRTESDAVGLAIGFAGRIARLARVHQFGERVRAAPGGLEYKYPARALLGVSSEDLEMIRNRLIAHLAK